MRRLRLLVHLHVYQLLEILRLERKPAAQHLVNDGGQAVDVGAIIQIGPLALLGRHIGRRAKQRPDGGAQMRGRRAHERGRIGLRGRGHGLSGERHDNRFLLGGRGCADRIGGCAAGDFGDAEIEHPHVISAAAVRLEPDVAGLQIAMDDAGCVRRVQRERGLIGHVHDEAERRAWVGFQMRREGLPVQILHYHVGQFAVFEACDAEIGHIDDVGMTQTPGGLGLALETLEKLGFAGEFRHDHLEGDCSHGAQMRGLKHGSHRTPPQLLVHTVFVVEDGSRQRFKPHSFLVYLRGGSRATRLSRDREGV